MTYAIEIENLWKKFRLYHDRARSLKEKLLFRQRAKHLEMWALKDINLRVKKGAMLGLIGQNGSGKSTLLKLLTRIIYPTRGKIRITGKISSLLELGAGFHPDFSGIENIYMNASIFGLTRREIDNKLNAIIDFSELEEFIHNPVRTYSSGMYMRLAFSVAINVQPEILLIDEILAVGDEGFQKKCFDKMESFKTEDITIVIVSHELASIEKFCDRVIWLHDGEVIQDGDPAGVIAAYRQGPPGLGPS